MKITEIVKDDLNSLGKLYVRVYKEEPWREEWKLEWAIDRLENIYTSPGFMGLKIVEKKIIKGAILGRTTDFSGRKELEITEFFVDPESQKKGLGKQLLITLEGKAKKEGYSYCTLLTSTKVDAFEFYKKNGYHVKDNVVFMVHEL